MAKISGVELKPIQSKSETISSRSTYAFTINDAGKHLRYTGTLNSFWEIVPTSNIAWADDTVISIEQASTGQVTITGKNGVTISSSTSPSTSALGSVIHVKKVGAEEWVIYGDALDESNMAMIIALS